MLTAQFRKLINPLCLISIIFDYYSVYFTIPLIFCVCGWWLLCSPHGFSEINFLNFPFIFYIELWSFSAHNATNCALFDYFQLCINLFSFFLQEHTSVYIVTNPIPAHKEQFNTEINRVRGWCPFSSWVFREKFQKMLLEVHCHLFCRSCRHTFSGSCLHHW